MDKTFDHERMYSGEGAAFFFSPAPDGAWEETEASVEGRVCGAWGFARGLVELDEGQSETFHALGETFRTFSAVKFRVNDLGWWTDFETLEREPELDGE